MATFDASDVGPPPRRPHEPVQLSITLRSCPDTRVYIHLTVLANCIMLFLTSAAIDIAATSASAAALGSFVYAMPDRYNPVESMSTPLYTKTTTIDFTTRLAKVLTRRTKKPCYVGGSIDLSDAASGGNVEEEMEAFRAVVEVVIRYVTG